LCEEKIDVICSKKELLDVSVLGPQRAECQVEISKTDARMLKIDPPIRESGDLTGSPGCVLRNGNKIFETKNGVIIAKRHIHIDPQKAAANKIRHKNEYSLRIETVERPLVFGGVIARVDENFSAAVHIDTDEANAAGICGETYGKIMLY
jgi:putative phosphotransacetylase